VPFATSHEDKAVSAEEVEPPLLGSSLEQAHALFLKFRKPQGREASEEEEGAAVETSPLFIHLLCELKVKRHRESLVDRMRIALASLILCQIRYRNKNLALFKNAKYITGKQFDAAELLFFLLIAQSNRDLLCCQGLSGFLFGETRLLIPGLHSERLYTTLPHRYEECV